MKQRPIIAILTILILFPAIDFAAGLLRRALMKSPTNPTKMDYLMRTADEDIIIIGNSAGEYNLVPSVLTENTGLTAFNAAESGSGLKFAVAQAEILLSRHRPKLLIAMFNPRNFRDYYPKAGFEKIKPLYGRGNRLVDSILESSLTWERGLLHSNLWLLNADLLPRLSGALGLGQPIYHDTKGYRVHHSRKYLPAKYFDTPIRIVSSKAIADLGTLRDLASRYSVPLIVIFPPNYVFGNEWDKSPVMKQFSSSDSFAIWNDTDHPAFKNDSTAFFDTIHLTDEAAMRYSDTIAGRIKKAIFGGKIRL